MAMPEFKCPLTEADFQLMKEICARCDVRRPFISALDELGVETGGLEGQNEAQQKFCQVCDRLHAEGRL